MRHSTNKSRLRKARKSGKTLPRELLRQLVSKDGELRKAARAEILSAGSTMVPHLMVAATSPDSNLRWEAVDLLGSIRDGKAISVVVARALKEEDVHVRWRSLWAITSLDNGSVVPTLLAALKSPNKTLARNGAVALSLFRRREAGKVLLKALKSSNGFDRWEAVNALGSIGDVAHIPALIRALKRETADVRREAALSLGRIGNYKAIAALLKSLEEDEDPQVRWRAALAISRIGNPGPLPRLRKLLNTETDLTVKDHLRETVSQLESL